MGRPKQPDAPAFPLILLVISILFFTFIVIPVFSGVDHPGPHRRLVIYSHLPPGNPISDTQLFNAIQSWALATSPPPTIYIFGPDIVSRRQQYFRALGIRYVPMHLDYKEVVLNIKILQFLRRIVSDSTALFMFISPYTVLRPGESAATISAVDRFMHGETLDHPCSDSVTHAIAYSATILGPLPRRLAFTGDWTTHLPQETSSSAPRLPMSQYVPDHGLAHQLLWGASEADLGAHAIRSSWGPISNVSWLLFGHCSPLFSAPVVSVASHESSSYVFSTLPTAAPRVFVSTPTAQQLPPKMPPHPANDGSVQSNLPWPGGALHTSFRPTHWLHLTPASPPALNILGASSFSSALLGRFAAWSQTGRAAVRGEVVAAPGTTDERPAVESLDKA
eukprot:TRINITY_DN56585_c0_g1_i1.p1 TRINITY_DN56585_c0_g1~~TRINITY_DN56585_c0_g1_i1.p1  ORF type:complete len:392 (+),score=18.91 TRINITY_DN56585_c0_g1_i1:90-1265(+)